MRAEYSANLMFIDNISIFTLCVRVFNFGYKN